MRAGGGRSSAVWGNARDPPPDRVSPLKPLHAGVTGTLNCSRSWTRVTVWSRRGEHIREMVKQINAIRSHVNF